MLMKILSVLKQFAQAADGPRRCIRRVVQILAAAGRWITGQARNGGPLQRMSSR